MKLEVFELERFQSEWENRVTHNLTESGVHPLSVEGFLDPGEREEVLRQPLVYVQTNGTPALRESIAALYPGATVDNVVATNGTAEANYISIWRLLEPGDELVMMLPNYMQIWGLARSLGATVVPWRLHEETSWAPDLDDLRRALTPKTRLIALCNPNNPTGSILPESAMNEIVAAAEKQGAWLLADEIYKGAERDGKETPSFWGRYDRTLATCGLSKAYGLPGLRMGWVVGPAPTIAELWHRKDYTSIVPGALSDLLARKALRPETRKRIFTRTREIINRNYPTVEKWLGARGAAFRLVPPRAGAITFPHYSWPINSTRLIERLRDEQSVLVVPGDQFGLDGYLRLGLGNEPEDLQAGLERIDRVLDTLGVPIGR